MGQESRATGFPHGGEHVSAWTCCPQHPKYRNLSFAPLIYPDTPRSSLSWLAVWLLKCLMSCLCLTFAPGLNSLQSSSASEKLSLSASYPRLLLCFFLTQVLDTFLKVTPLALLENSQCSYYHVMTGSPGPQAATPTRAGTRGAPAHPPSHAGTLGASSCVLWAAGWPHPASPRLVTNLLFVPPTSLGAMGPWEVL